MELTHFLALVLAASAPGLVCEASAIPKSGSSIAEVDTSGHYADEETDLNHTRRALPFSNIAHMKWRGGSLSQTQQNGGGLWGLGSLVLDGFRKDGGTSTPNGFPWGLTNPFSYNPYTSAPNSGITRNYALTLSRCSIAPDGVTTSNAICVNGQSPGPLIEANYGDMISVTVTNNLPNTGTAMHWHGMLQTMTNRMDGVPGLTQCPIPPGRSFTYSFKATLYGTSWYHSHFSAQYAGGVSGPIVVHGPNQVKYDTDLGPVMLADWYHDDYNTLISSLMQRGSTVHFPPATSNLINGKNSYPCAKAPQGKACKNDAGYSQFAFSASKVHRLRLVNTGSGSVQKFSIDGHKMQVIANDFVEITPYTTDMVALAVGQRADVLVTATGKSGDSYWMRSTIAGCSISDGTNDEALAAIYYDGADANKLPTSKPTSAAYSSRAPPTCNNDPLPSTEPVYKIPTANPSTTKTLDIAMASNGSNVVYQVNGQSFLADYSRPILYDVLQGRLAPDKSRNVLDFGANASVRLVLSNTDPMPHPIHLHGHNFQVLAVGTGRWDGAVVRAANPQRRDTQLMPPGPSYLAIQFDTTGNAGVWGLHCHFAWHSSLGLFSAVVTNPLKLVSNIGFQTGAALDRLNLRGAWDAFVKKGVVELLDSGV